MEDDYFDLGECCATCANWTRDNEESVYGQCSNLCILTDAEFYCSHYEDKGEGEEVKEETNLEKALRENPNMET